MKRWIIPTAACAVLASAVAGFAAHTPAAASAATIPSATWQIDVTIQQNRTAQVDGSVGKLATWHTAGSCNDWMLALVPRTSAAPDQAGVELIATKPGAQQGENIDMPAGVTADDGAAHHVRVRVTDAAGGFTVSAWFDGFATAPFTVSGETAGAITGLVVEPALAATVQALPGT